MMRTFPIFGLEIKAIGLAAIAAILSFTPLSMVIQSSYAQFGVPQEAYAQPAAPPATTTTSSQIPLSEPAKQIIADAQTQCPPNQNIS